MGAQGRRRKPREPHSSFPYAPRYRPRSAADRHEYRRRANRLRLFAIAACHRKTGAASTRRSRRDAAPASAGRSAAEVHQRRYKIAARSVLLGAPGAAWKLAIAELSMSYLCLVRFGPSGIAGALALAGRGRRAARRDGEPGKPPWRAKAISRPSSSRCKSNAATGRCRGRNSAMTRRPAAGKARPSAAGWGMTEAASP